MTLPFRVADVDSGLIPLIEEGLKVTRRLGLLGASVTQHPEFDRLLDHLLQPEFSVRGGAGLQSVACSFVRRPYVCTRLAEAGRGVVARRMSACPSRPSALGPSPRRSAPCPPLTAQSVHPHSAALSARLGSRPGFAFSRRPVQFARALSERNTQSLTIAVESGSDRVRCAAHPPARSLRASSTPGGVIRKR